MWLAQTHARTVKPLAFDPCLPPPHPRGQRGGGHNMFLLTLLNATNTVCKAAEWG